ncbi:rho-GTPase-activating protein-like protein [Lineolata rhizophorae]|uniref:Rho-GTPase-activating protein-like protein n=1 Tax=Lineolata rhizophorae TaxID=578093 RepID=A0A6A6NTY3_9PEZI|nr:rho-GTPase-activating protein-like protein [Lineolata rhizophorae]
MSGFANSFWSPDYAGGLGVLFGKLQQGVQENEQVLTIARMRADAEELYGQRLADIAPAAERLTSGFARDDGASVRKAYDGLRVEMDQAANAHRKIASNIRELVVNPFTRWSEAHAARVQNSQDDLHNRIKLHDRQAEAVRKFRSQYYNKCRLVEDLDEEEKLAFQDPQSEVAQSPKPKNIPTVKLSEPEDAEDEPLDIGDETYTPEQVKKILTHMLETIKLGETRVPVLGVYQNVSTGSDITEYIQKHLGATSISYAERIGQDMVGHGFLRLVGNVGNTFANSSRMFYQWKPKVFQLTGIPERRKIERASSAMSDNSVDTPTGVVSEYLSGWNPLNNAHPNETPAERLRREAREADDRYKLSIRKLDSLRCNLEEAMMEHLKFMERCELDRLKAIKAVILDFSGAISNVIPSLQSNVDNMMLFQETVQPLGDLRYMLENYRTGPFVPRVMTYENYYNSVDEQTFGVDLEARARSDRKRVPLIVTTLLTYLDNHYPDLEGDEARRGIWLVDVPLGATHHLRAQINTGKPFPIDILDNYEITIVASVLKLYLLELPDSLVSSHVYEIIKTIYTSTGPTSEDAARVSVIQSTLGQLRLANIATLDAIVTHFTRLIELTSADEPYVSSLANSLAPCILRPRSESSLTMNERFSYRLLRDLFAHKDAIFGELKRASALSHSTSGASASTSRGRQRAISTDESNRRAHMEERQRAIANRSRASSPAPPASPRTASHRRDRSTTGISSAETRFPIQTSPTERRGAGASAQVRNSLEVPGSAEQSPVVGEPGPIAPGPAPSPYRVPPVAAAGAPAPISTVGYHPAANGSVQTPTAVDSPVSDAGSAGGVEKRNSLGRSGAQAGGRFPRKPPGGLARQSLVGSVGSAASGVTLGKRDSVGSLGGADETQGHGGHRGVELSDRPMDD